MAKIQEYESAKCRNPETGEIYSVVRPKPPRFSYIINPADWEGEEVPDREWIVQDYIPANAPTLLTGDGGLGKSLLSLQLAVARALGRDWIGLLPRLGATVILSAEDDGDEMHRRLDGIRSFYRASWADLGDIRLIDLVGEDSLLATLANGKIEPSEAYKALDNLLECLTYEITSLPTDLVILDVLADLYPGDECARAHVRQFINLLKRICRKNSCAILLLAHPSLTGMNTGSGLSGSTDWNNGVRSRLYLQTPKTENGEPDSNFRTFQGMKSNYGERGGKIDVEWKDGVFVPVNEPGSFDKLAAEQKAADGFLANLKRRSQQLRYVSDKPGPNYAPAVFAKQPEAMAAGLTAKQLEAAMEQLFQAGKIRVVTSGPPSRQTRSIVPVEDGS